MPSVQELEQSLADLNGKVARAHTAHSAQTERRKKLGDELATMASKRAALSVDLARGNAKAGAQIDSLDQKEKSLERERAGVDQILAETKAEIANLGLEIGAANSQLGQIRIAERLQMLIDKSQIQEKAFLSKLDESRIATAELAVTLDALYQMDNHGKRIAQAVAERISETAHPVHAENSGWKRPQIVTGLAWQFFVRSLVPPGHPSHPGSN
jgi:chromosome segregation ATPase